MIVVEVACARRAGPVSLGLLVGVLVAAGTAIAQSAGGTYTLTAHAVAAGGGRSSGAGLALESSIGHPDSGTVLAAATYQLTGGFQPVPASPGDGVFGNGFE